MAFVHKDNNGTITVSYPTREAELQVTSAEVDLIRATDNKLLAIKFIRDQHKLGLYEAKQVVDTIRNCKTTTNDYILA